MNDATQDLAALTHEIRPRKITTLISMTLFEGVEEVKWHMTLVWLRDKKITQLYDKVQTGAMFKSESQDTLL